MKTDKLRIKGKANELIGRGKVMSANVSGSREGQLRGRAQQWKGKAQVTVSDVRHVATGRLETARARFRRPDGSAPVSGDGKSQQRKQQKHNGHDR